ANHAEIVDLLAALRRLAGVAVVVESELYAADPAFYGKQVAPLLGKGRPAAVGKDPAPPDLPKQAALVNAHKGQILNGVEAPSLSWRRAFLYAGRPGGGPEEALESGWHGVACRARVVITPDRRFVRLTLVQDVTDLVEIKKETVVVPGTDKGATVEV